MNWIDRQAADEDRQKGHSACERRVAVVVPRQRRREEGVRVVLVQEEGMVVAGWIQLHAVAYPATDRRSPTLLEKKTHFIKKRQ